MDYKYAAYLTPTMWDKGFGTAIAVPSIADVQSGFWVNKEYKFTRGEDALVWIPPASIIYVRKANGNGV